MACWLRSSALAVALLSASAQAGTVSDAAGRSVTVPDRVERVLAAGPPASVVLYVLKPEALIGWTRQPNPREAALMPERWRDKPVTGRLTGRGGDANLEMVLAVRPDLVLDVGSTTATYVDLADRVQEQTGLPYLLLDGSLDATAASLRLLGGVLGEEGRAEQLAAYAERTLAEIDDVLGGVPDQQRPRTYLARGPEALETAVAGSINSEIIDRAGAVNVAQGGGGALAEVSLEQVLAWDPAVVITWDPQAYRTVTTSPAWAEVAAVRAGRVHLSPSEPFGWIDRPPSLNRLLGLRWLLRVLHPDAATTDLRATTREFYQLFYHVDLDAQQLEALLADAGG